MDFSNCSIINIRKGKGNDRYIYCDVIDCNGVVLLSNELLAHVVAKIYENLLIEQLS